MFDETLLTSSYGTDGEQNYWGSNAAKETKERRESKATGGARVSIRLASLGRPGLRRCMIRFVRACSSRGHACMGGGA